MLDGGAICFVFESVDPRVFDTRRRANQLIVLLWVQAGRVVVWHIWRCVQVALAWGRLCWCAPYGDRSVQYILVIDI